MLALQGGGSHGAFTWGVLERLLDEPWLNLRAISGASAGALNGAAVTSGWMHGGRDGAREALAAFWAAISRASGSGVPAPLLGLFAGVGDDQGDANARLLGSLPSLGSPYQVNPMGLNPLRQLLEDTLDVAAIRDRRAPRLMVAATNVHSGQSRVFDNREITLETLLASACLPSFFQAVPIDGEYYWDGGYGLNPPLFPLLRGGHGGDLILVQLNPDWREEVPTTRREIDDRSRELTFNAGQLRELEMLAALPGWYRRWLPRLHRIDADGHLNGLSRHAPLNTDWQFLNGLRRAGHAHTDAWLRDGGSAIGRRSTLDLDGYRPRG